MAVALPIAGAALVALAGCGRTPEQQAIVANAELLATNLDAGAESVEDQAAATDNAAAREGLEAAADNLHDDADAVRDAAKDAAENL